MYIPKAHLFRNIYFPNVYILRYIFFPFLCFDRIAGIQRYRTLQVFVSLWGFVLNKMSC